MLKRLFFIRLAILWLTVLVLGSCTKTQSNNQSKQIETITLLGDTLYNSESKSEIALFNYKKAKNAYLANPNNPDSIIWLGRRTAYLGNFQKAIKIYSEGIEKHPNDARMYRHRGHRYISIRQYKKAIKDLEMAADLIKGKEDKIEPDGLPNDRNIPLSSLHSNIWYQKKT